jgi:hypothetical protein
MRFQADCERIQSVLARHEVILRLEDCERLWEAHSREVCAGWLFLPDRDETLWAVLEDRMPKCQQCGSLTPRY